MADRRTIDRLNRVLSAEYGSVLPRLRDSNLFVALEDGDDRAVVEGLAADNARHEQALVDLILDLRGAPVGVRYDIDSGGYHYLALEHLIPVIIESVREVIAAYAASAGTGHGRADALIAANQGDYQRSLAKLEKMHANLTSSAR